MQMFASWARNFYGQRFFSAIGLSLMMASPLAAAPMSIDQTETCDLLVVGGGLAGVATAYESLHAGRTVCLTEMTDWLGGQLTSQGTTALDEAKRQRQLEFYAAGYKQLRQQVLERYGRQNPGDCWVSAVCFLPADAHDILVDMLDEAAREGGGRLKWFPSTVVKELEMEGAMIGGAIAIQHSPAPDAPPLNTQTLSAYFEDAYRYADSERLSKRIIRFQPSGHEGPADWYVVEATETGEVIALAGVPYRLGLDPKTYLNPSSPTLTGDSYCTQGFTYTFAMERTESPQPQAKPAYYDTYAPYFSFERQRDNTNYIDFVFTYRRILAPGKRPEKRIFGVSDIKPGDISMQNWTWGNDYRPGTAVDNLIYAPDQLAATGQLEPGGWLGGLRVDTLRRGEENAFSYYHWLVTGLTDSQLGYGVKDVDLRYRFLSGFEAPMNTAHGLSKYPYIREGRRIVGRPAYGHPEGFMINEIDISRVDYNDEYYQTQLPDSMYLSLRRALAGLETTSAIDARQTATDIPRRTRSTIFPDSLGIAQYAIDFHPCMEQSPPELPGNTERAGVRRAHGQSYPGQIPLRAMIPQDVDNLLVAGKSIATSTIAAAAYRVHSFEWSAGVAAGATIDYALDNQLLPYTLVDDLPRAEPGLAELQQRLQKRGNPTAFPNTSIFNLDWEDWRVW
ncbi:FAD-dependent oxidoreductase [Leptolyngbya cf. ectocarpi LEGE 11479]|uniref:FAD-dependent oxidoreductase n=1 Tax=Leptolyngbya cf. ectocarpi LEGE 11479 TaxID=1828722 RepID=A0A928ZSI0_LEPEC|nr:FAD-dependent oxidoreductase [Leptolyngbya ectocarpi]MBE9065216.1 FAD-dependent oxidoreductase [Leptolyngbya cf. ectocarpi LEGE 11479]